MRNEKALMYIANENVFATPAMEVNNLDAVASVPLTVVKPVTGAIAEAAKTVKEEVEDLMED